MYFAYISSIWRVCSVEKSAVVALGEVLDEPEVDELARDLVEDGARGD